MDTKEQAKKWLKDFRRTQPQNVTIDEDSFEGSAYYIISALLEELEKRGNL